MVVVVALGACGRVGFDRRDATLADVAAGDVAPPDALAICHSGAWTTPQPLSLVNTTSHESDATVTADGLTLYYTSNRSPGQGYAIWRATRATTSDPFGSPMIVSELDTAADEFDPSISADDMTIYFDSNVSMATQQLVVASRPSPGQQFGAAAVLPILGDNTLPRTSPSVSPDGLALYFARSALEIAYATRSLTTESFTFVREIDEVNAPQTDGSPAISADGLELFFESFRTGTAEMYRSVRASTAAAWGPPVAVTELITSVTAATAAGGPYLSPDGRTLYMFLNVGQIDLYVATRSCD